MYKQMLTIGIAWIWGCFMMAFSQPVTEDCSLQNHSFQIGEKVEYKVYYNWTAVWLPAASVSFQVKEKKEAGQSLYHTICKGRTARSYDWFYKVRDTFESFIDPSDMKPLTFIRDIREGGYSQKNQYSFDHDSAQGTIDYRYVKGKLKTENQPITINNCTQDMLSAVYYLRCIDRSQLVEGKAFPLEIILDNELHKLDMLYLGKEELKTDFGVFRCLKIQPTLMAGGYFKEGDEMTIFVSDDDNLLPIYVESPLVVGKVKAYLKDFKNLRYELSSKVD